MDPVEYAKKPGSYKSQYASRERFKAKEEAERHKQGA